MTVEWLKSAVAREIRKIARIQYVFPGELVPDGTGPIELEFADEAVLLIEQGSDESSLRVQNERWKDPFEGRLDAVNREWVDTHGKWTRFDVSGDPCYTHLVGAVITDVVLVEDPDGVVTGAVISAGDGVIRVDVGGDDLVVQVV